LKQNQSLQANFEEIKTNLKEIQNEIEQLITKINSIISSLSNLDSSTLNKNIFNLSYKEYENIGQYSIIMEEIKDINKKVSDLFKKRNSSYKNLREINKEVNIIEHSKDHQTFNLNVMLGKKKECFSLFLGSTNQYAIFDLKQKFFLKEILISVKQKYKCVLKNFVVYIMNDKGDWEQVESFCCKDNNYEVEMQNFSVERETQFVKINFIDTYPHPDEADSMLIKKLSFLVADIY
jgi:flagellar biosynthesis chaperone FliJ